MRFKLSLIRVRMDADVLLEVKKLKDKEIRYLKNSPKNIRYASECFRAVFINICHDILYIAFYAPARVIHLAGTNSRFRHTYKNGIHKDAISPAVILDILL